MEDVGWLILLKKPFDSLAVCQVALNKLHFFQLGKRIGAVQPVSANNVPTFSCQEPHQVRPDESFCTSHQRHFLHRSPHETFNIGNLLFYTTSSVRLPWTAKRI